VWITALTSHYRSPRFTEMCPGQPSKQVRWSENAYELRSPGKSRATQLLNPVRVQVMLGIGGRGACSTVAVRPGALGSDTIGSINALGGPWSSPADSGRRPTNWVTPGLAPQPAKRSEPALATHELQHWKRYSTPPPPTSWSSTCFRRCHDRAISKAGTPRTRVSRGT
jgi:hypothetical protein